MKNVCESEKASSLIEGEVRELEDLFNNLIRYFLNLFRYTRCFAHLLFGTKNVLTDYFPDWIFNPGKKLLILLIDFLGDEISNFFLCRLQWIPLELV